MSGANSSGANPPVWLHRDDLISSAKGFTYPKLEKASDTDVLIVGGGMAGLHIAYELLESGLKKVTLIEDGKIGSGETGRTTGHLSTDNNYNDLLRMHGAKMTADVAAAQQAAIERIAQIVQKHKIDCDFVRLPGYMFSGPPPPSKDYDSKILKEIYDAAKDTKAIDVSLVEDANIPGFPSGQAIKFGQQATFHPTKYLRALAKIVTEDMGGTIYEDTHMNSYEGTTARGNSSNKRITVKTAFGPDITADHLVMATNIPMQKLVMIDRCEAYRTYAVAFKIKTEDVSTNGEDALWWDTADPYHYIRVTPHKDEGYSLLVVGGEDEKVGQHDDGEERYVRLIQWTKEHWKTVGPVEYKWSGQVVDTVDGIAYLGKNPGEDHVYVHTGDNGDGLTYAAVGGMIIRDLILERENPWAYTFSPSRQHSVSHLKRAMKALPELIKGNLSNQVYYAKWISTCTKTITDIEDLVPGQGEVVREGIHPVAVYKDENGDIHKMTAICPHLKGIVAWNSDEKSFDCPIHGSRFTYKGDVINGPAKGNLTSHRNVVE